jgi:DNA-binding response OmpR family regulator
LEYGSLTLDTERHEVSVGGSEVSLTAKEFALLEYLLRRRGKLATREALLNSVWGYDADVTTRTVDVHIRRLREKIPALATAIQTVKPYGYKLADDPAGRAEQ